MLSILHSAFVAFVFAGVATAQIDGGQIPQACQAPCKNLLDLGNTCMVEYPQQGTKPTATSCLCNGLSSLDYSSCTACLNTNAPMLAQSVSQLSDFCSQFINGCGYECSFDTCPSSDVQCQCKESYLQDIYNCAYCNSGHGNMNTTNISDYAALSDSCTNQGQTVTPTGAEPAPTPSGTIPYTGGGFSVASFSSGSHGTRAPSGTAGQASFTTARTSGTNTGTRSTSATPLIGTPTGLTGGSSGKIKGGMGSGRLACMVALMSMLIAFGELA